MVGIYLIRCKSENKVYIGQSKNIIKRYKEHIYNLKHNIHPNCYLQNAFNNYGSDDFCLEILYEIDEFEFSREKLYDLEIKYISKYDSSNREKGYNIESGGNGVARASKETCEKLSNAMKGKFVGRKLSEQTKLLMSKNNARYWLGKHLPEETKNKLSQKLKGRPSHLKGTTLSKEHINKKIESQLGRVWVCKGEESRFVSKEMAEELLKDGYVIGRPFFKRIKGAKHQYNGGFYTVPQIAEMCGIDKSIIFARIRQGWSIEQATVTPKIAKDDKKGKHLYNGEYLNLTYISKLVGIDYEILRSRLRRGMSLDEAIAKPIKKRNR